MFEFESFEPQITYRGVVHFKAWHGAQEHEHETTSSLSSLTRHLEFIVLVLFIFYAMLASYGLAAFTQSRSFALE